MKSKKKLYSNRYRSTSQNDTRVSWVDGGRGLEEILEQMSVEKKK